MYVSYANVHEIDPSFMEFVLPLPLIQEGQENCHLPLKEWALVKERALNSGKMPPGGLPRNSVVKSLYVM